MYVFDLPTLYIVYLQVEDIQLSTPSLIDLAAESGIYVVPANSSVLTSSLNIMIGDGTGGADRNETAVRCIAEGETILDNAVSDEVLLITFGEENEEIGMCHAC